jgi:hypothetical protein
MMRGRPKSGDVVEIQGPEGLLYLGYLGTHREYGDAVMVSPAVHAVRPTIGGDLFRDGYVAFYPLRAAVSCGLALIVGKTKAVAVPHRLRRAGARTGRTVTSWIVEDGFGREEIRFSLSKEELLLPIAAIWNHELLVERLVGGWRPEKEGKSDWPP